MDLQVIKSAATSKVGLQLLLAKKHSPAIMFGAGIAAGIGCVITACNATLKLENVVTEAEKKRAQVRELQHVDYSERDRKKDHLYLNIQTTVKVCKLYAPTIGLGVLSVGLLTGSHITLTRRNAGLTAAYAAVTRAFDNYRDKVREEIGEERERELRYNVERYEQRTDDPKKGTVDVKEMRAIRGDGPHSPYARLWDDTTTREWKPQPEYNIAYIKCQQEFANQRLQAKGYVILNDVYDALGLERTKEGCVVGWLKNNPDGDGHIDFGFFDDEHMEQHIDFMTGRERGIWLDFNVDGVIYDKI